MRRAHVVVVLGSVTYTALLLLTSLATGATILMAFWRPLHARLAIARGWARLQIALLQRLCGLSYTVEGVENLPAGAHVALWKHSSAWETIAQMLILPPQVWVLKRELLWLPVIGWATRLLAPIAINRAGAGTAVSQVVTQGKARLGSGLWVVVFPEGTRVPVGASRRYGLSGALLASEAGCLVVPVAHNAGLYWGRRAWLKKPGVVRVVIGKPIPARGREPREVNDEARAWIDATVASLGA